MEAGDLMLQFCSTLFTRLAAGETGDKEDSASLTLALQDCLAERFPYWSESDQWGVTCTGPGLACLSLTLATPWPIWMGAPGCPAYRPGTGTVYTKNICY